MADLQNFSVTPGEPKTITVSQFTISGQITDSADGAVLADLTGANAIPFLDLWASLPVEQQMRLVLMVAPYLMLVTAGMA